jgi:hypothetical protein
MLRRSPTLGFVLALLCILTSVAASAGEAFPGVLFYAKGANWRSETTIAAPLATDVAFNLDNCVKIGPSPCDNLKIAKGGAFHINADFVSNYFAGPAIGVFAAPAGAWTASSFLEFSDGVHRTAFTVPVLRYNLDSPLDDYRSATAARKPEVRNEQGEIVEPERSTCSTFYTDADHGTAIQVVSYGADGDRARDAEGNPVPTDVYFLEAHVAAQGCLGDWRDATGSLQALGPVFDAGSLRLSFGCAGVGPCPGPARTWFVVTKGPVTGATVETLAVENVGAVAETSPAVRAQAAADDVRRALIRLHGRAPNALRDAVEQHNADVTRWRSTTQ